MKLLLLAALIWGQMTGGAQTDAPPNPVADSKAVIIAGHARFTVLTPAMIRMEWSADDRFEDRASFAFVNRRLEVPEFTTTRDGDWTIIKTPELTLRYRADGGRFANDNLSIELQCAGKPVKWTPGMPDTGNLRGTTRTLDGVSGACELEPGLLSRDGWAVVDDSKRLLFENAPSGGMVAAVGGHASTASASGESHARSTAAGMPPDDDQPWVATRNDPDAIDWYFFGYGHDYKRALLDFTRVGGKIPLPPRYVFGAWWSRYWAYSDAELRQLVQEFDDHDVPLDVLVVDMDWHLDGWTGYTWNPKYFPDPKGFLDWAHEKGLKVTLNLHPADGVGRHEAAFADFAKAMGVDPAKTERIPFDCTDRKYMDAYFRLLHHPLEKMGVDFWWMDWQQGTDTKVAGLDPLFWLNHLHWNDMARNPARRVAATMSATTQGATAVSAVQSTSDDTTSPSTLPSSPEATPQAALSPQPSPSREREQGRLRPLIFSRWGGLGNHRYPIGFSGDTYCNWESLAFQPYFTATAGNVGYAYWSHDIGGHQPGRVDPELYVRWIQWGALSPILRTHTTKNPDAERRIWAFPEAYFLAAREAYRLRYQLLPYIYTMARKTYDTGLPLCRPLYYEWPELDEAYTRTGQYMFGDDLMVAPVTEPGDPMTGCANMELWIPPGKWTNWFTGRTYEGPRIARLLVPLEDIPLFVREGAVIPMIRHKRRTVDGMPGVMALNVFPGNTGESSTYMDDGITDRYLTGESSRIRHSHELVSNARRIEIEAAQGRFSGFRDSIKWVIKMWEVPSHVDSIYAGVRVLTGMQDAELNKDRSGFYSHDANANGPNYYLGPFPTDSANHIDFNFQGAGGQFAFAPPGFRGLARLLTRTRSKNPHTMVDEMWKAGLLHSIELDYSLSHWHLPRRVDGKLRGLGAEQFEIVAHGPMRESYALPDDPGTTIRFLGLFHKFGNCIDIDGSKLTAVQTELVIAPTLPIADFSDIKGTITFDAGSDVANLDSPRAFVGLTEDKPVVEKIAITFGNDVQTMRLRANVKLTKGEDSVAFPLQQTLFPSINHWWVVGPFEATFEKGLATGYPPEGEAKFDAAAKYDGKGGKKIEWRRVSRTPKAGDDPTKEFFVDLNHLYHSPGDAVAYAMTHLTAPADMDATLAIGSDDGSAIWLNGAEVYRLDVGRAYTSKQDRVSVKLKKGANPLLIKVKQGTGGWGFCVHVENEKGEPLPEVKAGLER